MTKPKERSVDNYQLFGKTAEITTFSVNEFFQSRKYFLAKNVPHRKKNQSNVVEAK